jgi:hypothetical protein
MRRGQNRRRFQKVIAEAYELAMLDKILKQLTIAES